MAGKRGPKGRFVKTARRKPVSKKAAVMAKTKKLGKPSLAQLQREYAEKSSRRLRAVPTQTINMHGSLYKLHDEKPRTKSEAQGVRVKLKAQGFSAFLNPRKRKTGVQYFIYKKPSEHAKARVGKPIQKVSKRTGVPTQSINMHGRKYNIHDNKPRTKSQAQALRKKLVGQGKSAFLNPRRRKSGTEYFVYQKVAERRIKATTPKKSSPRKSVSKSKRDKVIEDLEAQLRRLKAQD